MAQLASNRVMSVDSDDDGMAIDRRRPKDLGTARASDLRRWVGRDLKLLRISTAQTQRQMAHRSGISQSFESEIERGTCAASVEVLSTLAQAGGGRLVMRIVPGDGVSLRDSGQMDAAQLISTQCHARWHKTLEMPIGLPPDRRAADLVIEIPEETNMIEVERAWIDHQGQYRPLQLKRAALSERLGRSINLIIALLDTERSRQALAGYEQILRETAPMASRHIWAALRSGEPIGGDGILWVRPSALRARRPAAKQLLAES